MPDFPLTAAERSCPQRTNVDENWGVSAALHPTRSVLPSLYSSNPVFH
jgi:hypothetical protein